MGPRSKTENNPRASNKTGKNPRLNIGLWKLYITCYVFGNVGKHGLSCLITYLIKFAVKLSQLLQYLDKLRRQCVCGNLKPFHPLPKKKNSQSLEITRSQILFICLCKLFINISMYGKVSSRNHQAYNCKNKGRCCQIKNPLELMPVTGYLNFLYGSKHLWSTNPPRDQCRGILPYQGDF